MLKFLLLACLFFSTLTSLRAQGEWNNWLFGWNAGLTFNGGAPAPLTGGQVNTFEGSASFSTANGQLLFYTDGITVWNKSHGIMPNGSGLMGDPSATQSALIVPKPGADGRYYIFTTDAIENDLANGLRYSEVDMSLNGGLGDVIPQTKNKLLANYVTERVTGVRNGAGNGYWVITHKAASNEYLAYSITASGVNETPIVSAIGLFHAGDEEAAGYMKISPDGKKLAVALEGTSGPGRCELLDFNANTGTVSAPITFTFEAGSTPYGVEFSPDSKKLYFGLYGTQRIVQVNLDAGSPANIITSAQTVATPASQFGALQLGPDGKIYIANMLAMSLSTINNPNALGAACNFAENSTPLGGFFTFSQMGLPNTLTLNIFAPTDPCQNSTLRVFTLFRKTYVCPDCNDGKIAISAINGVPPYQYSIDGVNFQSSGIFNNLVPNTYVITIRDAAGCTITRTVTLGG